MKLLYIFFFSVLLTKATLGQDIIRINPVRALLGEVQLFYEKQRPNPKQSIQYKISLIYPLKDLNVYSSINSKYGYFEHFYGLNWGGLVGIALRKYPAGRPFYFEFGVDMRFTNMRKAQVLTYIGSHNDYTMEVSGNHISVNPKFLIGKPIGKKHRSNLYFGIGASGRYTKITAYENCFHPNNPNYCDNLISNNGNIFQNPNGGPTLHLGFLQSIYSFKK